MGLRPGGPGALGGKSLANFGAFDNDTEWREFLTGRLSEPRLGRGARRHSVLRLR